MPLLGVELDDSSHSQTKRQERDQFVENVFKKAGLPLKRIPVRPAYNPKDLGARLASRINVQSVSPEISKTEQAKPEVQRLMRLSFVVRNVRLT